MAEVVLDKVNKQYENGFHAVRDLDLDIADGEFLVLVGPSGCGKSTALRMVAGLEDISTGTLRIGDRVVNTLSSRERDIAMVFQSYALYPHMSVADNIAYGLKIRRMDKAEIDRRVKKAADMLELGPLLQRKPKQLSGGQRQRVAMGRAIVREPQVFLMDEPLSNLDAKLRVQMRSEIAQVQKDLDVTTIYVTHDQTEAMTMGDRVALMKAGLLQQVGNPQHLYDHPDNIFVAGFIGSPPMNLALAKLERSGDGPGAARRRRGAAAAGERGRRAAGAGQLRRPGDRRRHPQRGHGGRRAGPGRARGLPAAGDGQPDRGTRVGDRRALQRQRAQGGHRGHQGAGEGRAHRGRPGRDAWQPVRRVVRPAVPGAPRRRDRDRGRPGADALLRPRHRHGRARLSPRRLESAVDSPAGTPWWRGAVVYQVYLRSFADADGDGSGDVAGLRSRLPYLRDLGVDALWVNPWYPSPMVDGGYDVADYRSVDPRFGSLADAEALLDDAHRAGLRVLLDIVPNHTSDQHPWFQAAVAGGAGSAERLRYLFRPGRGSGGDEPPNDWRSVFGSSAWTRVTEPDGRPGEWYLHLFAAEQPDLDWTHPDVRADFEKTLAFWFDRGVDGFRIDVAHSLVKQEGLPDVGSGMPPELLTDAPAWPPGEHPHWDREEVHEVYREWRAVADSYDEPRVFVAEAWVDGPERLARYVRPDELHTAFAFDFLVSPWRAPALRQAIEQTLVENAAVGAPPTWVLSNHDTVRPVSRYAREQTDERTFNLHHLTGRPADLARGARRARAAVLLMLALPGSAYLYQGDELALPEVEDLPEDALQDPEWTRSGHTRRGRDGCRVPLPWTPAGPSYGFSPPGAAAPWLPQPPSWRRLAAAVQAGDPASTLELHRAALQLRRSHPALGDGTLRWQDAPADVLAFARDPGFGCLVNLSDRPVPLPAGARVLLASDPVAGAALPPDTAAWLDTGAAP